MNGHIIPGTPIAVDFWKVRDCPSAKLFFLSHLHSDHMVGLRPSWNQPIYCSVISALFLARYHDIKEELLRPLQYENPHLINMDDENKEHVCVTLIDANHCPGSAMFLFEGYFGRVLYTGDFRYKSDMVNDDNSCLFRNIEKLYLDNTYCSPSCSFPSRAESLSQIVSIIKSHPHHSVVIGIRNLGKETLLASIGVECKQRISVPGEVFDRILELDLPDVFNVDEPLCRIRTEKFHRVSQSNLTYWNKQCPTIAILPTALYNDQSRRMPVEESARGKRLFVVPYSDHSSYNELYTFVHVVKPKKVTPIVPANARGPGGVDISSRADMSCFKSLLNQDTNETDTVHAPTIPDSVKRWMGSTTCINAGSNSKKRKIVKSKFKRSNSEKGVVFENNSEKKQDNEANEDGKSVCEHQATVSHISSRLRHVDSMFACSKRTLVCVKSNSESPCDKLEDFNESKRSSPRGMKRKLPQSITRFSKRKIHTISTVSQFFTQSNSSAVDKTVGEHSQTLTVSKTNNKHLDLEPTTNDFKYTAESNKINLTHTDMHCEIHVPNNDKPCSETQDNDVIIVDSSPETYESLHLDITKPVSPEAHESEYLDKSNTMSLAIHEGSHLNTTTTVSRETQNKDIFTMNPSLEADRHLDIIKSSDKHESAHLDIAKSLYRSDAKHQVHESAHLDITKSVSPEAHESESPDKSNTCTISLAIHEGSYLNTTTTVSRETQYNDIFTMNPSLEADRRSPLDITKSSVKHETAHLKYQVRGSAHLGITKPVSPEAHESEYLDKSNATSLEGSQSSDRHESEHLNLSYKGHENTHLDITNSPDKHESAHLDITKPLYCPDDKHIVINETKECQTNETITTHDQVKVIGRGEYASAGNGTKWNQSFRAKQNVPSGGSSESVSEINDFGTVLNVFPINRRI